MLKFYQGAHSAELLVKEGSLRASWNHERSNVVAFAIATDATHGPLIAAVSGTEEFLGDRFVRDGSLRASWNNEWGATFGLAVAD